MSYLIPSLIILLLIVLNGLFVAAEFAIVASRRSRLLARAREGNRLAERVAKVLESPQNQDRYIAVAQLGITLASVGLGMYGERSIASWLLGPLEHWGGMGEALAHTVALIISVAILTYLHVVIGEMIPKALALQSPEPTALGVMRPMRFFGLALAPLVWTLNEAGNLILRLFGVPMSGHGSSYTVQELEQLVDESAQEGEVLERQHELIDNIFNFSERTVGQLMTHRTRVVGIDASSSLDKVLGLIQRERYSRFPVYEGDLDHIIGILHVRDLIRAQVRGEAFDLGRFVRRAPRVPEKQKAEDLFEALKRLKIHMAVVMNEYGGTAGIVTLEDLLEEVVGEVQDEYDDEPEGVERLSERRLRVQGKVLLSDLARNYDVAFDSGAQRSDTIAGLIVDALGEPPEVGDEVTLEGVKLEVEEVEGLAITQLALTLPEQAEEETGGTDEAQHDDQNGTR